MIFSHYVFWSPSVLLGEMGKEGETQRETERGIKREEEKVDRERGRGRKR